MHSLLLILRNRRYLAPAWVFASLNIIVGTWALYIPTVKEKLQLDDDVLVQKTYNDLRQLIHLPDPPIFTKVLRPDHGIPQLEIGYPKLLSWRNRLVESNKGLYVCGFGWEGIGLNDMMKAGAKVAEAVLTASQSGSAKAEIKGIYF